MCGIAGRFSPGGALPETSVAEVALMTQALIHRGPDAGGLLDRAPLGILGHRRLSIIDLASGQQPMGTADGMLWVTFNGEIYNYRELRSELAGEFPFQTSSDTEVILAAYRRWGDAAPERLEGMFAFALLDLDRRRMLLARDHLGKKPLYIRWRGGILDFASELPALRHAADWRGEIDPQALAFYLRLGYIPSPWSIYGDVGKLRPGECAVVDSSGLRRRKYWDLPPAGDEGLARETTEEESVARIEAAVAQAVDCRLMSEVPLGAFLSGGIDSSIVVAEMARLLGPGVQTVTIGFGEADDEYAAARLTARHMGTDHAEFLVRPDFAPVIPEIVGRFGEPFADSSALPTWFLCREARRKVTVALSGDGGDEPFGGYDFRYFPHLRDARLRGLVPGLLRRPLFRGLAAAWPRRHDLPRPLRLHSALRNLSLEEDAAFFHDLAFMSEETAERLAPDIASHGRSVEEHVRAVYRAGMDGGNGREGTGRTDAGRAGRSRRPRHDPLQAAMRADVRFYLPEDVLVKVDRMSMAHALEVRSPFLSKRIVELAFSIPGRLKMAEGRPKRLLRAVAARRVPREILDLPKRGFHIPQDRWFRGEWRDAFAREVLEAPEGALAWVSRREAQRLWREHQDGTFNRGYDLWALWVLRLWLEGSRKPPETPQAEAPRLVGCIRGSPGASAAGGSSVEGEPLASGLERAGDVGGPRP